MFNGKGKKLLTTDGKLYFEKKTKTIILMDKKRFVCIQGELFDVIGNMVLLKNIL